MKIISLFIILSLLSSHAFAGDHCRVSLTYKVPGPSRGNVYAITFDQALKSKTIKRLRKRGVLTGKVTYLTDEARNKLVSFEVKNDGKKCHISKMSFAGERFPSAIWGNIGAVLGVPFAALLDLIALPASAGLMYYVWRMGKPFPITHQTLEIRFKNNARALAKRTPIKACNRKKLLKQLAYWNTGVYCDGEKLDY